jgi:hypothetical protein
MIFSDQAAIFDIPAARFSRGAFPPAFSLPLLRDPMGHLTRRDHRDGTTPSADQLAGGIQRGNLSESDGAATG